MMTAESKPLRESKKRSFAFRALRMLWRLASDRSYRHIMWLYWMRPKAAFQPFNTTSPNRYPAIFRCVQTALGADNEIRILSFGCSTGDEVFSLRHYFPRASIKGIDINPANIAVCKQRNNDAAIEFQTANSTSMEPTGGYDAIFCMAVLRHGGLAEPGIARCDHLLRFDDFAKTIAEFDRCLKPGGVLAIRHSNFRFADTPTSRNYEMIMRGGVSHPLTPVFGPDNVRLPDATGEDVVFRKRN
jgi:2-polyprenyl-3-methyl-5-hydroxy-6-metoxy-1,4-benzoquinol methylase